MKVRWLVLALLLSIGYQSQLFAPEKKKTIENKVVEKKTTEKKEKLDQPKKTSQQTTKKKEKPEQTAKKTQQAKDQKDEKAQTTEVSEQTADEKVSLGKKLGGYVSATLKVLFDQMLQKIRILFVYITKSIFGSLFKHLSEASFFDEQGNVATQVSILERLSLKNVTDLAAAATAGSDSFSTESSMLENIAELPGLESIALKPIGIVFEFSPDTGKGFGGVFVKPTAGILDDILIRIKKIFKINIKSIADKILFNALKPFVGGTVSKNPETKQIELKTSPFLEFLFRASLLVSNQILGRLPQGEYSRQMKLLVARLTETKGFTFVGQIFEKIPAPFRALLSLKIKGKSIKSALTTYIKKAQAVARGEVPFSEMDLFEMLDQDFSVVPTVPSVEPVQPKSAAVKAVPSEPADDLDFLDALDVPVQPKSAAVKVVPSELADDLDFLDALDVPVEPVQPKPAAVKVVTPEFADDLDFLDALDVPVEPVEQIPPSLVDDELEELGADADELKELGLDLNELDL